MSALGRKRTIEKEIKYGSSSPSLQKDYEKPVETGLFIVRVLDVLPGRLPV